MKNDLSIILPIGLIAIFPLLLILQSMINVKSSPGGRFKIAAALLLVIWSMASVMLSVIYSEFTIWDWLAGVMLLLSVILFAFMLWSVLCWGYTLSMLLCLEKNSYVDDLRHWQRLYTQSDDIRRLTLNRMQLLVWMKCVSVKNSEMEVTAIGYRVAYIIRRLQILIGMKQ